MYQTPFTCNSDYDEWNESIFFFPHLGRSQSFSLCCPSPVAIVAGNGVHVASNMPIPFSMLVCHMIAEENSCRMQQLHA